MLKETSTCVKLIVSIVKKGCGSKAVTVSKAAGAAGGTIIPGRGTAKKGALSIFQLPDELEKEIVLTMVPQGIADSVLSAIGGELMLDKPGEGIAFTLGVKRAAGLSHAQSRPLKAEGKIMEIPVAFDLLVIIVKLGGAEDAISAARKAGAEGATIIHSRGAGVHENAKLFSIPIEPEKEVLLILTPKDITDRVLKAVTAAVDLDSPGQGIAFVMDVEKAVGICHLYDRCEKHT